MKTKSKLTVQLHLHLNTFNVNIRHTCSSYSNVPTFSRIRNDQSTCPKLPKRSNSSHVPGDRRIPSEEKCGSDRRTLTKENVRCNRFDSKRRRDESHSAMFRSMQHAKAYTRLLISGPHRRFTWRVDLVERRSVSPRLQVTQSNDSYGMICCTLFAKLRVPSTNF